MRGKHQCIHIIAIFSIIECGNNLFQFTKLARDLVVPGAANFKPKKAAVNSGAGGAGAGAQEEDDEDEYAGGLL